MSTDPQNVPPAGEEIHLPPGSLQPLALTVGLTIGLIGLTKWPLVSAAGFIILFWAMGLWIRDARREHHSLPAHHAHGHDEVADTADADAPAAAEDASE